MAFIWETASIRSYTVCINKQNEKLQALFLGQHFRYSQNLRADFTAVIVYVSRTARTLTLHYVIGFLSLNFSQSSHDSTLSP